MTQREGINGYLERAAAAMQAGHVNRHGDVRVRRVWVGDRVTLDRGPERRYRATVIALGDSRVKVEFTYKNGRTSTAWATPIWQTRMGEPQRVTDRENAKHIDNAWRRGRLTK